MKPRPDAAPSQDEGGFTLVELIVVIGIIALMAALSLPAIGRFIRNYRIRGATQQVVSEIQAARNKAIVKNANLGVVFLVTSPTTYRFVVEDDQTGTSTVTGTRTSARQPLSTLLPDPAQAGPVRTLPLGIQFVTPNATNCPTVAPALGLTGGTLDKGMRFNRLGAWCDPGSSTNTCPDLGVGSDLVYNAGASGSVLCLATTTTGVKRAITVTPGGRAKSVP
jgi:prepilin-type N-terminal cleavage/methylation domain-containing protein